MKKLLLSAFIAASIISSTANAAATLHVTWTDPTPVGADYTPYYYVEYQVADAQGVTLKADVLKSSTPSVTAVIDAAKGNTVKVRMRGSNIVIPSMPIPGPWSDFYTAMPAATPLDQTPNLTVFAY